jgi:hypothetical protein
VRRAGRQVTEGGDEPVRSNSLGSGAGLIRSANKRTQPWDDIVLGPLIGTGSFGKVYRSVWNGSHVAVKARARPPPVQRPRLVAACARRRSPQALRSA